MKKENFEHLAIVVAAMLIEMVLKTEAENLRLENGQIVLK